MSQDKRTARAQRGEERGFTLIETAISLLVMMVAGLGVVSLFAFSVTYNKGAADRARAAAIAQQRMEVIRNTPFNNLNAAFAAANSVAVQQGAQGNDVRRFDVATTIVNDLVVAGTPRRKTITVTVTPQTTSGQRWESGAVRLVTQRASHEMGPN